MKIFIWNVRLMANEMDEFEVNMISWQEYDESSVSQKDESYYILQYFTLYTDFRLMVAETVV